MTPIAETTVALLDSDRCDDRPAPDRHAIAVRRGPADGVPSGVTADDVLAALLRLDAAQLAAQPRQALCEQVVAIIGEVPGIAAVWLWRPDGTGRLAAEETSGLYAAEYAASVEVRIDHGPLAEGPAGRAWRSGMVEISDDWLTEPTVSPWRRLALEYGWRSSAVVPLRGRDGLYRLLALRSHEPGFFSAGPMPAFIRHLATVLGLALEQAEIGERDRVHHENLDRLRGLYRALLGQAKLLLKARSEAEVLRATCRRLVDSGLFVMAWIGRPAADGQLQVHTGAGPGIAETDRLLAEQHATAGRVLPLKAWSSGKLQFSNDRAGDPDLDPLDGFFGRNRLAATAALPIRRGGAAWGVLAIASAHKGVFTQEMLQLLARVGDLIGRALDECDLKEQLRAERAAQSRMARHDPLTSLPNRLALSEHLPQAMARARRQERILAVAMMDLDNFKPINDQFGHAAGDYLLREIAARLRQAVRATDFVARLGGDEFALVLEGLAQTEDAEVAAERIRAAIEAPIMLPEGASVTVGGSLGMTLFPLDDADGEVLLRHADVALYGIKERKGPRGRCWDVYRPSQEKAATTTVLRGLLARGQVRVHYQPIIDLQAGTVVGVEALARIEKGSRLVYPGEFLPHLSVDERKDLSRQVLEQGLSDLSRWDAAGIRLDISFNAEPDVLMRADALPCLDATVCASGIEPSRITVELLESGEFLSLDRALVRVQEIRARGVGIALDDVGSAYSSLLRLRSLPVDKIKLDQAFGRELHGRPDDLLFVLTVQALARGLDCALVVEGVETADILDALSVLGVKEAQGYAIARPMPVEALAAWVGDWVAKPATRHPRTLLGAYASHLEWTQTLRTLPSPTLLADSAGDAHACPIGCFLDQVGLHDTALGDAHKRFHDAVLRWSRRGDSYWPAAATLRQRLLEAITASRRQAVAVMAG